MRTSPSLSKSPRARQGSAVVILLALLAIMVIYVSAEFAVAVNLDQQLKSVEKRQLQRLEHAQPKIPAASNPERHG